MPCFWDPRLLLADCPSSHDLGCVAGDRERAGQRAHSAQTSSAIGTPVLSPVLSHTLRVCVGALTQRAVGRADSLGRAVGGRSERSTTQSIGKRRRNCRCRSVCCICLCFLLLLSIRTNHVVVVECLKGENHQLQCTVRSLEEQCAALGTKAAQAEAISAEGVLTVTLLCWIVVPCEFRFVHCGSWWRREVEFCGFE